MASRRGKLPSYPVPSLGTSPVWGANAASPGAVFDVISLLTGATLTRAGDGTYWDDTGTLQTAGTDVLRQDHDPATGAYRGVLVEQAATNALLNNRDLSAGTWFSSNALSQTEVGIDGAANAAWLVEDNDTGVFTNTANTATIADDTATHAVVAFLDKKASDTANARLRLRLTGGTTALDYGADVDVVSGTATPIDSATASDVSIEDAGGQWCIRISGANNATGNTTAAAYLFPAVIDRSSGSASAALTESKTYDYGAIFLNTDIAYSPILTAGTAVTRPDEILTNSFSQSSGTLHLVGEHVGGDGVLWQSDNTTENNRIRVDVVGGDVRLVVDDGGVNQATLTAGALAADGKYDLAFRFADNDFAISLDGAAAVTDTAGTVPTVTTQRFGADTSGPTGRNWIRDDLSDYRTALLTNSELEILASEPCKTLESPGILSAGGAGAMAIDGLTATNTDGSLQGAHVKSTVAAPAVGERFLFEVHYNPLDWAGATGSNYVAIGNALESDRAREDLGGTDGQANSSLALAVFNDAGTLSHFIYDSSGALITFNSTTTLTEHYAQVISEHAGGSVTFVTDKANFIVPVPADPNFTDFDWCGNVI